MSDGIFDVAAPHAPQYALQRSITQIPTQQPTPKVSRLSRISSYIGLGSVARAGSPTTSTFPEIVMQRSESMKSRVVSYGEAAHDRSTGIWRTGSNMQSEYDNFRESDRTWHSPNIVQMMETVSCTMMANGISEPIPRHLNASIISMIEEFRVHLGKLKTLQADFDGLRSEHQNEAKEFANTAHEWKVREIAFNAEIKRLEHIISHTQEGAESVILARAGSIVDRNDGGEFQTKLNYFSRSKGKFSTSPSRVYQAANLADDCNTGVSTGYNKGFENMNMEEMRTSINLPDTTLGTVYSFRLPRQLATVPANNLSYITDHRPRLMADHNRDVRLTELLTRNGVTKAPKQGKDDADLRERMVAARHFYNTTGRPCPPCVMDTKKEPTARISNPSTTSSSSKISRSSSSSSPDAQGALVKANKDHVTPRTTPVPQHPIKVSDGENALAAIQEILKTNGGFPEDAVDDGSCSDSSFVLPHKHSLVQCSHLPVVPETKPISHFNSVDHGSRKNAVRQSGLQRQDSSGLLRSSRSSSSSDSSQSSHRSLTQIFMESNHATDRHVDDSSAASEGLLASKASSRQGSASSASVGSSPSRKVQSALDITLSQETIDAARRERTIDNYHTKTSSFIRPEDFRALPPQPKGYVPGQQRPRYTTGPPPGLPVHPLLRHGQTQLRRPVTRPVFQARAAEITGNQDAITAATEVMARSRTSAIAREVLDEDI